MPLRGEDSLKSGIYFEHLWTIYCLAKVLNEEYDSIHLAALGVEGQGCEFLLKKGEIIEYHQVKQQQASGRSWSIADLARIGILETAFKKTEQRNSLFIFFSEISVGTLFELAKEAKKSASIKEFLVHFLKGERKKSWEKLLKEWKPLILQNLTLKKISEEEKKNICDQAIYERLQKISFRHKDKISLKESVHLILRTLIKSDPENVLNDLHDYIFQHITEELHPEDIWSYLRSRGYQREDYSKDGSVLSAIEDCNRRNERFIIPFRDDIHITKKETQKALDILLGDKDKKSVIISGEAGIGKSIILKQIIKRAKDEGIPYLYFRIDQLDPTKIPRNVGINQLGLPESPAVVLGGFARSRKHCLLIIDQLDAVSSASGRKSEFFYCIHEIIQQAENFPNMGVLMACRTFDLEKDSRLRELISPDGIAEKITASLFSPEEVKEILQKLDLSPSDFTESQIKLFLLPFHLSLFAQLAKKYRDKIIAFFTAIDLFNAYWEQKKSAVVTRIDPKLIRWTEVFDKLCAEMNKHQILSVEAIIIPDDFKDTIHAMESENILISDGRRIRFFHDKFFDYVFARRFIENQDDLIEYLKEGGQHLFKRAPMRQILMYEHASGSTKYMQDLGHVSAGLKMYH